MRWDSFSFPKFTRRNRTMRAQLSEATKKYHLGLTQGGSAKKFGGAKVAARDGLLKESNKWEPK